MLAMRQMDLDELGLDVDAAIDFLGRDRLIRKIGIEDFIRAIGVEQALQDLVRLLGKERVRQILDKMPTHRKPKLQPFRRPPNTLSSMLSWGLNDNVLRRRR